MAHRGFAAALARHFAGAMPQEDFIARTYAHLRARGFDAENTIACVGVCRDELTRGFVDAVQRTWGEAFNCSSLAGMLFLGRTGFRAAAHHAPRRDGVERYVFFALPHIALGPRGEPGLCRRPGRPGRSTACGALAALCEELRSGRLALELDPEDIEQSLLKQRLLRRLRYGERPDLVALTKLCHEAVREDLERMTGRLAAESARADYAVLTGIQIHGPNGRHYVWPGAGYVVINRRRRPLRLARPSGRVR